MGAQIVVGLLSGIIGALLATFIAPRIQHYFWQEPSPTRLECTRASHWPEDRGG